MRLRNEIFASVLDWLVKNKGIDGQKGLSKVTGISQNTVSRIMTGKVEPSDDTLRKLNDTFGGIFNMQYLRGIDPYHMLAVNAAACQSPCDDNGTDSLFRLATQIVVQLESLHRELRAEKEQTAQLNARLTEALKKIETLTPSHDYLMASEEPIKTK